VAAARVTADAMPRRQASQDLVEYWIEVDRLENDADSSTDGRWPACSTAATTR